MAARNLLLARPQWVIANQLTMPLVTIAEGSGKRSVRGLVQVIIPFTIFLDTLFTDKIVQNKRSAEQEQFQVYKTIEGALQTTGIDGKACLLRAICEVQRSRLGDSSLAGEFATLLLTPKKGDGGLGGFLHDYLVAERVGHSMNQTCAESFPMCKMSIFDMFTSDENTPELLEAKPDTVVMDSPKHNSVSTDHHNDSNDESIRVDVDDDSAVKSRLLADENSL